MESGSEDSVNYKRFAEENKDEYRPEENIGAGEYASKEAEAMRKVAENEETNGILPESTYVFEEKVKEETFWSKWIPWISPTITTKFYTMKYKLYYYVEGEKLVLESFGIKERYYSDKTTDILDDQKYYYSKYTAEISKMTYKYVSIASQLRPFISTWYKALRRIAVVGLLSVLLYIGIKIVLSSAAGKESSKYKKMLIDWLVALCLLFTLHYIMALITTVTKQMTNIFNLGATDVILNDLRKKIDDAHKWMEIIPQVLIYVTITIFTVTFTLQYLKRVLYMAFYTLIAPLVALSYPIDKINDGQAQAFNMWLREYIFTALIQVIHLIIYFVFVQSAVEFATKFPLYAVIALLFINSAEKIIRKMFGFNKATTIGTMEAVTAGALISNGINKLRNLASGGAKKGSSKEDANEGEENKIRTANPTRDPLEALRTNNRQANLAQIATGAQNATQQSGATSRINTNNHTVNKEKKSAKIIKGAMSIGKKYWRPALKGVIKGATDIAVGGTGAIIGAAAGISQGSLGGALSGAVAGAYAGKSIRQGVSSYVGNSINGVRDFARDARDTFNEGAYGEGYANTIRFKRTQDYKDLKAKFSNLTDANLQAMIESGITDKNAMQKILKNGGNNINEAIGYYTLAKKCPDEIYYADDKTLEKYLQDLGIREQDAKTMREKMKLYRG